MPVLRARADRHGFPHRRPPGLSLGAVELIVAIHRVFDTGRDRLVFDVGHQCYAHKILTGRNQAMETPRTFGGIAGFPNRWRVKAMPLSRDTPLTQYR